MSAAWRIAAAIAAVIGAVVLLAALLGIYGEMHYRNCLTAAGLRYPVAYGVGDLHGTYGLDKYSKVMLFPNGEERDEAISDCSRWP